MNLPVSTFLQTRHFSAAARGKHKSAPNEKEMIAGSKRANKEKGGLHPQETLSHHLAIDQFLRAQIPLQYSCHQQKVRFGVSDQPT